MSKYMILIRHFLVRLANNESVSFQDERQDMHASGFAVLTIGGALIAHFVFKKFLLFHSSIKVPTTWTEHSCFFAMTMALTGLVSLMAWDHFFLDRSDFQNLVPLPLNMRTLYIAKFASTVLLVLLAGVAVNLLSTAVIWLYLVEKLLIHPFRFIAAHAVSSTLAVLFAVFAVAALRGVVMVLCPPRLYERVKAWMQGLLSMAFISVFVWFPKVYSLLPELRADDSSLVYLCPPCWFSALHHAMTGSTDPFHSPLAAIALISLAGSIILYLLTLPWSLTLQQRLPVKQKNGKLLRRVAGLFFRDSRQMGIFHFIIHTLRRSQRHKFYTALFTMAVSGYALGRLGYIYVMQGAGFFNSFQIPLLSLPFILGFLVLTGVRFLVEIPVSPSANWMFRITETCDQTGYMAGVKKTVILLFLLPLFVSLLAFYVTIWPFGTGVVFSVYCLVVYLAMLEIFFLEYRKIPFASVYNPGFLDFKATGILFFLVFTIYLYLFMTMGLLLILNPVYNLPFYVGAGLFFWGLKRRERELARSGLVFFQESEPVMLSLNLSQ